MLQVMKKKQRFPLYRSKEDYDNYIHLLYYEGKYNDEDRQHYAYIKNFDRFMYDFTKHKEKSFSVLIVINVSIHKY